MGLGTMVVCQKGLQKISGVAKLAHLNRRNLELLLLRKIDTIFEVFDDETEAVNSFFPERGAGSWVRQAAAPRGGETCHPASVGPSPAAAIRGITFDNLPLRRMVR